MLFESGDVRLWVSVKYVGSDVPVPEKKLSNGEQLFVVTPGREFEVVVASVGPGKGPYQCGCTVGEICSLGI